MQQVLVREVKNKKIKVVMVGLVGTVEEEEEQGTVGSGAASDAHGGHRDEGTLVGVGAWTARGMRPRRLRLGDGEAAWWCHGPP